MFSAKSLQRMTQEQRKRIAMLGVQARELKRLNQGPPPYRPIPEGLQLAAMVLDFRCEQPRANHILLFDAGYKNRYEWILNNQPQDGLIGWHNAIRHVANHIRPIITE